MKTGLFDYEGPVISFVNRIVDMVVLSMLWMLCCIPIITIGASSTALYYCAVKVVRKDQGNVFQDFFFAFRTNFKKATLFTIIMLIVSVTMFCFDIPMLVMLWQGAKTLDYFWCMVFILKVLLFLGECCWFFPILSRYEEPLIKLMKASLGVQIQYFVRSIGLVALLLLSLAICVLIPVCIVFVPCSMSLAASWIQEPVLLQLGKQKSPTGQRETTL